MHDFLSISYLFEPIANAEQEASLSYLKYHYTHYTQIHLPCTSFVQRVWQRAQNTTGVLEMVPSDVVTFHYKEQIRVLCRHKRRGFYSYSVKAPSSVRALGIKML